MDEVETEPTHINVPGHFYVTVDYYADTVEVAVRSKSWEAATHIDLGEGPLDLQEEIGAAVSDCVKYIIRVVNVPEPDGTVH